MPWYARLCNAAIAGSSVPSSGKDRMKRGTVSNAANLSSMEAGCGKGRFSVAIAVVDESNLLSGHHPLRLGNKLRWLLDEERGY